MSEPLDPKALAADLMLCYFASRKSGRPFNQKNDGVCTEPLFQPFGPWLEPAVLELYERGLIDKAKSGRRAIKDPRKGDVVVTEAGRARMLACLEVTTQPRDWRSMAGRIQQHLAKLVVASYGAAQASSPEGAPATADEVPSARHAFDPKQFADDIQAVAPTTPDGWFHDIKVLIAPAYRHFVRQRPEYDLTLEAFKQRLLEAHQEGELRLSRAEMGEDGSPDGRASEIQHLVSKFHYIELPRRPS